MLTKYAALEGAQILELRSTPSRAHHASLGKLADFHEYRTEDGYLYARIRAISSRVNKNWDGWPSIELAGGQDVFDRHTSAASGFTVTADRGRDYGFSTFLGKPIFVDHHNSDPDRARGVIVDAKFHVEDHRTASLDPYYASPDVDPEHLPGAWVELLLEVDAKAFPKFAKAIVEGSRNPKKGIDGWSMGCDVEKSVCSICKHAAASPEDYCDHVRMKGAYFDHVDHKTGHKTSRRAYENCYGVRFFEISGVFDPADETALSLEGVRTAKTANQMMCPNCSGKGITAGGGWCRMCEGQGSLHYPVVGTDGPMTPSNAELGAQFERELPAAEYSPMHQGSVRTADNPPPQSEMSHAPEHVDTLREEHTCPVCGSSMDEDTCEVCSYQEPPDGFGNPDLTKVEDVDVPTAAPDDPRVDAPNVDPAEGAPLGPSGGPETGAPKNPALAGHVTKDMEWDVHTKTAARINKNERPIVSTTQPQTNEPTEKILTDQLQPVTSRVRTAEEFIAAAGATRRHEHMNHTAEAASGAPADAKPDVRTDVTGVGGVDQASNDAASKADAQVDVTGIGGTGVEGVASEEEGVNVEQGDEHSKNIESIPTKTWGPNQGDSLGQQDPVTSEVPSWVEESRWSHWHVEGHEDGTLEDQEQQGSGANIPSGGAVKGVKPIAEQFGDRVDVLDPLTSPANNSGPTTTWTGTDGNGVLKQQDPVTNESIALSESGLAGKPNWSSSTHIFAAFKLADLEIDLGLLPADRKYERAAELEHETPEVIQASLKYAQRVRSASRKAAGVQKLPVMGRPTPVEKEAKVEESSTGDDSFMFGA